MPSQSNQPMPIQPYSPVLSAYGLQQPVQTETGQVAATPKPTAPTQAPVPSSGSPMAGGSSYSGSMQAPKKPKGYGNQPSPSMSNGSGGKSKSANAEMGYGTAAVQAHDPGAGVEPDMGLDSVSDDIAESGPLDMSVSGKDLMNVSPLMDKMSNALMGYGTAAKPMNMTGPMSANVPMKNAALSMSKMMPQLPSLPMPKMAHNLAKLAGECAAYCSAEQRIKRAYPGQTPAPPAPLMPITPPGDPNYEAAKRVMDSINQQRQQQYERETFKTNPTPVAPRPTAPLRRKPAPKPVPKKPVKPQMRSSLELGEEMTAMASAGVPRGKGKMAKTSSQRSTRHPPGGNGTPAAWYRSRVAPRVKASHQSAQVKKADSFGSTLFDVSERMLSGAGRLGAAGVGAVLPGVSGEELYGTASQNLGGPFFPRRPDYGVYPQAPQVNVPPPPRPPAGHSPTDRVPMTPAAAPAQRPASKLAPPRRTISRSRSRVIKTPIRPKKPVMKGVRVADAGDMDMDTGADTKEAAVLFKRSEAGHDCGSCPGCGSKMSHTELGCTCKNCGPQMAKSAFVGSIAAPVRLNIAAQLGALAAKRS